MLDVIKLLPDSIANQIAAGEVVQRPSSIIKELLENSIDAKATDIQVILKDAGRTLVQVIDNGLGMSATDARLSFERHATSKIKTSDDLFNIKTMGFRGEALASIAAIAQVELKTRRETDEIGTMIKIEASDVKNQEAVSMPVGTNLMVKNLFFNVPARRNFLKSNPVEMKHIIDEFQRIALAHPEVSFSLHHNDVEVYQLMAGKLNRRITDIFGKSYREQLAAAQETTSFISITGYVGKPESAKKSRGEQFFFVNKRFIKSSYLHHAVMNAFDDMIPDSHSPFYVLFIEIDPQHIDINIHPTKSEIKFDDEKAVYAMLQATIKKAVGMYHVSPSLDFDSAIDFSNLGLITSPTSDFNPSFAQGGASRAGNNNSFNKDQSFEFGQDLRTKTNLQNWSNLFEIAKNQSQQPDFETTESLAPVTLGSKVNRLDPVVTSDNIEAIQISNQFVAAEHKGSLLIIDQKAAYERILYEKYSHQLKNSNGVSQQLLFPRTLTLQPADFLLVNEIKAEIMALGFQFEDFGQNTIVINGVPSDVQEENEKELFEGLVQEYKLELAGIKLNKTEHMALAFAKRNASRYIKKLTKIELSMLVYQLLDTSMPSITPSGEPIMQSFDAEKLNFILKR